LDRLNVCFSEPRRRTFDPERTFIARVPQWLLTELSGRPERFLNANSSANPAVQLAGDFRQKCSSYLPPNRNPPGTLIFQ
jgi:hypothetical protein